jgi:hypothetical protein
MICSSTRKLATSTFTHATAFDAEREVDLLLRSVRKKGEINPVWWSELVPAAVYP